MSKPRSVEYMIGPGSVAAMALDGKTIGDAVAAPLLGRSQLAVLLVVAAMALSNRCRTPYAFDWITGHRLLPPPH